MSAFNTRDCYQDRPPEVAPATGGYNRNYWHAVIATMGGGDIDPLFHPLALWICDIPSWALPAVYFRLGMPAHEIEKRLNRPRGSVSACLEAARREWSGQ
ncbi:MAG: hypothetical protein ACR652_00550 [Methylocystis sp.]|uniref:hypothetical protein n=1 Tax=Methylocystis sp. TaxID=1911079 RepID=UPI003DA602A2